MPFARSEMNAKAGVAGGRWGARLARMALGIGLSAAFLAFLSSGAWAGNTNLENSGALLIKVGDAPSAMLARVMPINDTDLAKQVAKGLSGPTPSLMDNISQPRVVLWDEVDRPANLAGLGGASLTILGGH
jgi:hypothetical protein